MRRLSSLLFVAVFALGVLLVFTHATPSSADELDELNKQINELTTALNNSKAATAPLESQLKSMQAQLAAIKGQINAIEADIVVKRKTIDAGYENLAKQEKILAETVRDYYIKSYYNSPLLIFLSSTSASEITQTLAYQKAATDQDKLILTNIALTIQTLEIKKRELEQEQDRLSVAKANLDEQSAKLDKIVGEAKTYQATLSSQIAQLSAKQQQLVAQKLASLNIPRSAGTSARGCSDDRGVDPGFSPRLAFFTYGAPHRNGLNQYGAWGRAKKGQNAEQILQAYYPNMSLKTDYNQDIQISTTTGWSGSIENYVKRIYEVPDSWTDNDLAVLKAQAVAARTYALNVTANGAKQICTSESCQVFKDQEKGGNWNAAVEATKGWVLMDGGNPGFTQYASTHGGYILNLGKFDGDGGNPTSFAELNERAFDKESPWFYCDWGARSQYGNTAWLKSEEVADIANVILLARKDGSLGKHLYQPDKPNPEGTDTWDAARVRQELGSTALTSVSDISVTADFNSGKTTNVVINGQSFPADEFKNWFNLRAPANLQIVGPLYNVEKK
ncbi:MAG: hypothetical protein HYT10_00960 [Candidatus Levybacteria bacterium]|nr:hypothetical protein [Candidatus Levybacteria bacterium]